MLYRNAKHSPVCQAMLIVGLILSLAVCVTGLFFMFQNGNLDAYESNMIDGEPQIEINDTVKDNWKTNININEATLNGVGSGMLVAGGFSTIELYKKFDGSSFRTVEDASYPYIGMLVILIVVMAVLVGKNISTCDGKIPWSQYWMTYLLVGTGIVTSCLGIYSSLKKAKRQELLERAADTAAATSEADQAIPEMELEESVGSSTGSPSSLSRCNSAEDIAIETPRAHTHERRFSTSTVSTCDSHITLAENQYEPPRGARKCMYTFGDDIHYKPAAHYRNKAKSDAVRKLPTKMNEARESSSDRGSSDPNYKLIMGEARAFELRYPSSKDPATTLRRLLSKN